MLVKNLVDEDFLNYKKISMFIGCNSCTFKCEKDCGENICQNSKLAKAPNVEISPEKIVERYLKNQVSQAIVFGGLEPFDDIKNVIKIIEILRNKQNLDDVIIYSGYTEKEIKTQFYLEYMRLKELKNVIIKFGRYIPGQEKVFDEILGIYLASSNQYAKHI